MYPDHSLDVSGSNRYPDAHGKSMPERTEEFKALVAAVDSLVGKELF